MNQPLKKVLVIRFSAMGDVVLTIPIIQSLLKQYPDLEIAILTKPFFQTFFENISRVTCISNNLEMRHKGVLGLRKLVNEIVEEQKIDAVIDLHSVLRSFILDLFFKLKGIPIYRIDKGRKERKKFINKKIKTPLKHTTQRYQEVFIKAGFEFEMIQGTFQTTHAFSTIDIVKKIGIAPFAAHRSKMWGIPKIYELIEKLNCERKDVQFYLFGGGKKEVETLEQIANYYNNVENMAGKLSLREEIQKISEMDVFLTMDSGNMHIATLTGIPVVSIWGGTDPDVGFSAMYQPEENKIQMDKEQITCRPCSVFGTSKCTNSNPFSCMNDLEVEKVLKRIRQLILD